MTLKLLMWKLRKHREAKTLKGKVDLIKKREYNGIKNNEQDDFADFAIAAIQVSMLLIIGAIVLDGIIKSGILA